VVDQPAFARPCRPACTHAQSSGTYNKRMSDDPPAASRSSIDDIIELYKKDVDRSLLREALKLTPDQRVRRLVELTRFTERLSQAAKKTGQ
jgi:hypothetical protein